MIEYLSQNGMDEVFRLFAEYDPNLEQYGFGQLFNENGLPKTQQVYPGLWVNPVSSQVSSDYAISRSYEILIYDIPYLAEGGLSNQNKIVSDCEEIAFRLVRFLKTKSEVFDATGTPTITPFADRWLDAVSGVVLSITLVFNGESSICDDPVYPFGIQTNYLGPGIPPPSPLPAALQTLEQTLSVGNESGTYSIGLDFYYQYDPVINSSVSGFFTQSLDSSNSYFYTLTGNTTFSYTAATYSIYNFFVKAGTYSFTLNSGSNWQTIAGTALGFTGSFVISAGYDGSDLWVAATKNFLSL